MLNPLNHLNTYLLWDVKVSGGAIVRVMAESEESALKNAEIILPGREYEIVSVGEYWLPGTNIQEMAKSIDRLITYL